MKEYKPSELFQKWVDYLETEMGVERYSSKNRRGLMHDLVKLFVDCGVDYDVAKKYKTNVLYHLVTAKGRLDEGKYSGWLVRAGYDYDTVLCDFYQTEVIKEINTTPLERLKNIEILLKDMDKKTPILTGHSIEDKIQFLLWVNELKAGRRI